MSPVHHLGLPALREGAGMGTVVSTVIPYTAVVLVTWTLFFIAWVACTSALTGRRYA